MLTVLKMADELEKQIPTDYSKLKVPDLKKELKVRGLSTTGNKNELIERLQKAIKSNDVVGSESVDDLEEDLLNDDDDEHLDASESVILENDLDESPKAAKRQISESPDDVAAKPVPHKKVILKRNSSIVEAVTAPQSNPSKEDVDDEKSEKKTIKLSQLTAKERLEMRAKKFGVTALSVDAKKIVRAERFGVKNNSAASITTSTVNTTVDVLKKRAERFGSSVSPVMSGLENKDKLEKRKARFGSSASNGDISEIDKAKLRLERFKQPIK